MIILINKNYSGSKLYLTSNVSSALAEDEIFASEVVTSIAKYAKCDWGDLSDEDKFANNSAVLHPNSDRIVAAYNTSKGRIYIITEADNSATTVLFSYEY